MLILDWVVGLFADASITHYGAVVTQIPPEDVGRPLEEQRHQPLAFFSGPFTGSMSRWSIVDKEAFATVAACKRFMYLLLRAGGFRIFTDHRNLQYIFDPLAVNSSLARHQVDRLQRWGMTLTAFRYVIEHVRGEDNLWADLLTRWGAGAAIATPAVRAHALVTARPVSPLQAADFAWPTPEAIVAEQMRALEANKELESHLSCDPDMEVYLTPGHKVWIPDDAVELQQRLCVVAHAGLSGHRGIGVTTTALSECFSWSSLRRDVQHFVRDCLHCLIVGDRVVPRPYGPTLHATKPNEILHFDCRFLKARPVSKTHWSSKTT